MLLDSHMCFAIILKNTRSTSQFLHLKGTEFWGFHEGIFLGPFLGTLALVSD